MLELYDPLWDKLGEHIPTMLSGLAASWDDEIAKSLLFDDLCHQETCYGATYAAIPHLLKIAEAEESRRQRREIAFFLGFERALRARPLPARPRRASGTARTLEGWDRTGESLNAADQSSPTPPYHEVSVLRSREKRPVQCRLSETNLQLTF